MQKIKLLLTTHKVAIMAGVAGFVAGFLIKGMLKPKGNTVRAYRKK